MRCELCKRAVIETTKHHLIPRTRHKNKRIKRDTTSKQRKQTVNLCQPCTRQIHTVISEKDMAENYCTVDALREHPIISDFIIWVKKKPCYFHL